MLNIYVIGCGGIGGYLTEMLPMAIASLSLDILQSKGMSIQAYLDKAGNIALPCVADRLTLVDGDIFNARNSLRQGAGAGSKLAQRMQDIQHSVVRLSYLQNMKLVGYNAYVNPANMSQIIPEHPEINPDNADAAMKYGSDRPADCPRLLDNSVVFLCVDNLKTRYEVSKYMENFQNCLVINGGNEKTSGHVTLYERRNGEALDPNIYDVYPNITPDADKRPDEEACTEMSPKHDQIAVTNSIVANIMIASFNRWARSGLTQTEGTGERKRTVRKNEVIIDTDRMSMISVYHPLGTPSK
jgi:molybdopterin/thiamine biosynthesis adenylyltransferase